MKKILILCTHNSARSQMAEALVNHYWNDRFQAFSAGTKPDRVNPHAIKVMKEIGIDISNARSKGADEFIREPFDLVITVCDHAKRSCPFFPGSKNYVHRNFADPSAFKGNQEEILSVFRRIRDEIKKWLNGFLRNY